MHAEDKPAEIRIGTQKGGFFPAVGAAVAGFLLANWFFTPPFYTFTIGDPMNGRILSRRPPVAPRPRSGRANGAKRRRSGAGRFVASTERGG